MKQPVCLIVIDGWGVSTEKNGNAILAAETPVMDRLCSGNCVNIEASGLHVGLPRGLMGNSEVGHLNIGAGRVVWQDIVRIDLEMEEDKMKDNINLVGAFDNAKSNTGRLHFLGLVSDGGVHAHINHLLAFIKAAKHHNVPKVFIHFFSDGRDTPPNSGVIYLKTVLDFLKEQNYGSLSTVMGRFYAMDRDKRWERIQKAYEGLVGGRGEESSPDKVIQLVQSRYAQDQTDEFLTPIIVDKEGLIRDKDTLVFIDYRSDRMREIVETMGIQRNFDSDIAHPAGLHIRTMTQYNEKFTFPILYPAVSQKNVLAEALSSQGVTQFHCAETEKYPHVTFFFNGGREIQFEGEERMMVPSPKEVPTYDLKPVMNSAGVADEMVKAVLSKKYPFTMCNFAPPDMVGHTGKYEPTIIACAATDVAIGRIEEACKATGTLMFVTADHGNAEQMYDDKGGPFTAHTSNLVPFASTGAEPLDAKKAGGRVPALRDVAPTCLVALGLKVPPEMDGVSLL